MPEDNVFSVRFLSDGQTVQSITVSYGDYLLEPEDPELPSPDTYFVGWFLGNLKWDFSWGVVQDMDLVAKFDLIALKFECNSSFKITPNFISGVNLKYSLDEGSTWNNCTSAAEISVNSNIYFRGTGNTAISSIFDPKCWSMIPDNGKDDIRCSGNIETLLDYQDVLDGIHPSMDMGCFFYIFAENAFLASSPQLPATELSPFCYALMFQNCVNLKSVPILPPVDVYPTSCYMGMFTGCKKLHFSPWTTGSEPFLQTKTGIADGGAFMIDGLVLQDNTSYYCFTMFN